MFDNKRTKTTYNSCFFFLPVKLYKKNIRKIPEIESFVFKKSKPKSNSNCIRMERDPRGGEAKKASPVHSPSDSVIDDLLWTTYGINPRRQMEYKPLTNDDQKSMSKESHVDPKRKTSTEGDGGSGSSFQLTPGQILASSLLLSVGVSLSGETISDDDKEVMKRALLRGTRVAELVAETAAMGDGGSGGGGVGKFSINGVGGVGSGGGVDCSTEKWRDWRYIEDDQEREAAKASSKEAMEKQHAKANDGMKDDLCKRLSKHFTAQAAKKQNPAEK